jgi:hypothetical protein
VSLTHPFAAVIDPALAGITDAGVAAIENPRDFATRGLASIQSEDRRVYFFDPGLNLPIAALQDLIVVGRDVCAFIEAGMVVLMDQRLPHQP